MGIEMYMNMISGHIENSTNFVSSVVLLGSFPLRTKLVARGRKWSVIIKVGEGAITPYWPTCQ